MKRMPSAVYLSLLLTLSAAVASAQVGAEAVPSSGEANAAEEMVAQVDSPAPAAAAAQAGSGLPRRAPPPRTMAAHWPVFALFSVSWIGIIAYLLVSGRRVARLAERLVEQEEAP